MHELSIAMSILELAEEEGERHHGRVSAVHLKLGALSGVVKEALLYSYEMACEDTPLAGSRLIVEEVAIVVSFARSARPVAESVRRSGFVAPSVEHLRPRSCRAGNSRWLQWRYRDGRAPAGRSTKARFEGQRCCSTGAAWRVSSLGRVRGEPGFEPGIGQDGVPRENADAASTAIPSCRAGWGPGH